MEKRPLGRTGMQVSRVGFGAWPIGSVAYGEDIPEAQARACLETYVAGGGNFIDTARRYGSSERRIGEFLESEGIREQVVVASKTNRLEKKDIRRELEQTLRELRSDYVDLYYLHAPPEEPDVMARVLDTYEELKNEGKIKAIGASIKGPDVTGRTVELCRRYIRTGRVDALQVIFSIFRQKNREVFGQADESGVAIVARTVLESGFLTGKYGPDHTFPEGDHRRRWGPQRLPGILADARRLAGEYVRPPFQSLAQVAMRFVLDEPHVTSIIPGAKTPEQAQANLDVAALPPLDQSLRQELIERFSGREEEFNTGP